MSISDFDLSISPFRCELSYNTANWNLPTSNSNFAWYNIEIYNGVVKLLIKVRGGDWKQLYPKKL